MDTRAEEGGGESFGADAVDEMYHQCFGVAVALGLIISCLLVEQRIERA